MSIRPVMFNKASLGGAALAFAVTLLAAFGLSASIGTATSEAKIFACKKKSNGALRVVTKRTKCKRSETKLSWGTRGRTGRPGKTGPGGPAGAPGPGGPSSYVGLGPLTIRADQGVVDLYDLGYGVRIQVQCVGNQSNLVPRVYVNNTAENTYLSSFSAAKTYSPPILNKMATIAPTNTVAVSSDFPSTGTASASSQVFISVMQLSDANAPKVFYATIVPWAEAQTTTCKFAGGLTRVAG
jgi:hypothetical protein